MIDKRLWLALLPATLLACDEAPEETSVAPSEVLEGTISDSMLPVDRVRSEAPLEDPEAFAEARGDAAAGPSPAARSEAEAPEAEPGSSEEAPADPPQSPDES